MNRFARLTAAFGAVFAMVLGSPTPAKADPITAAIVTAVGFTGTAAAVATFVINGLFTTAFSWAAGKLLGKSKASVQERQASVTTLSLGEVPREALIGEAVTGGSLIDAFNHGGQYGTDYVTRCIALVDHAVDDLVGYYIDDQYYPFSANGVQGGFSGALDIEFVNATEAGAAPPARFLTASGGSWISTDVLAGITHVWFSYKCDEAVWPQGHPQVRFLLRGLKAYDPRKDAALGYEGVDAQTWSDPSTHTFTRNAALLRYAFARGIYAEGRQGEPEHLLIGRGLSAEEAPPEPVIAAANLCDEDVDGKARYTANGVIRASDDFIFVEEMFAAAMAGVIVQREGGVEIEPGQAKAAVVTITDADLVAREPVSFSEFLSDGDGGRINTVIPRYIEPAQTWKDHSGPVRRDLADIAADGGPREVTLPLMLVTEGGQADRCAEITRLLGRLEKRATIVLPPEYGRLEEGDWIAWTSARRFDGETMRFRIESWTLDEKWRMRLSLREIAAAAYGEPEPLTDESDPPSDPLDLDPLELQDVTAEVVLLEGAASGVPAVRFAWSAPDPAVIAIRAEVRRVGETVAAPTRTDEVNDLEMTVTNGVGPDQDIEVRLVPIAPRSRAVTASDWIALTTGALTAGDVTPITPGDVAGTPTISITSTIASDGTQTSRLFGSWTAPADALTYIVELDNGTIVQQIPVTENAIEDHVVATGPTYRYRVKAISRTGTLSAAWSSWSGNATASGDATIPPNIASGSVTAIGGRRLQVVIKRPSLAACPDYSHALLFRNTTGFSPDDVPQDHIAIVTGETYTDISVTVGTLYRYWARSVDRSGNEAAAATFLGSGTPVFVSVGGGDVDPDDDTLVTGRGTAADVARTGSTVSDVLDLNLDVLLSRTLGVTIEQDRALVDAADARDRFNVLGTVDPIGRQSVFNGDTIQLTPGGLFMDDADTRVSGGLSVDGDVARPLTLPIADSSNILRRTAGGLFSGDLSATEGATWGLNVGSRPAELTDGRVGSGLASNGDVARPLTSTLADSSNILRRAAGGLYTGSLTATAGATWGTDVGSRPAELTDGRITTALNSSGVLQTAITSTLADTSNILRRAAGGLYTGSLTATAGATWGTDVASRPTELTDGRIAAGLDSSGDVARPLTVSIANSSNLLRRSGGGTFTGALDATNDSAVTTLAGTLGDLATSALSEDKVQGRFLGEYAGDAAAITAGIQNGDTYIDTSLFPKGLKTMRGGTITEVNLHGMTKIYAPQMDVPDLNWTLMASLSVSTVAEGSFITACWTATIESTPSPTTVGSGTLACAGTWKIIETGSGSDRTLIAGAWSAAASGGTNVSSFTIDSASSATAVPSAISPAIIVPVAGAREYRLEMRLNTGDVKPLNDIGVRLFVQVQRPPA